VDGAGGLGYRRSMESKLALTIIAALSAVAVFAGWRGARPPNPHKGPRLVPWRWIMVLAATAALLVLSQLALDLSGPR
jgi:hypothetical protein